MFITRAFTLQTNNLIECYFQFEKKMRINSEPNTESKTKNETFQPLPLGSI